MLHELLQVLGEHYGTPGTLPAGGPLEMILWENVAYLVDEERRRRTFETLKREAGISPQEVVKSKKSDLRNALAEGGILHDQRVKKLTSIMKIVLEKFNGDLNRVLDLPPDQAIKALRMFPGIGEPGAEKILLFCRRLPVLALESNGLRVLLRIGYGDQHSSYATTYRSVRKATQQLIQGDYDWLIRAHQLLRIHGQQICKRNRPRCKDCPVLEQCRYGKNRIDIVL